GQVASGVGVEVHVADSDYEREVLDGSFDATYEGDNVFANVQAVWQAHELIKVRAGIDHLDETGQIVDNFGTDLDEDADQLGLWTGVVVAEERYEAEATIRYDDHSDEGDATTWRLAAAWFPRVETVKIYASAGTSFRAPALYEQYAPFSGIVDLEAEEALNIEIGHQTRLTAEWSLHNVLFRTDYDQRIVYDFGTFTYANSDSAEIVEGLETVVDGAALDGALELTGTWTWYHIKDSSLSGQADDISLRLPTNQLQLVATWSPDASWWLRGQIDHASDRRGVGGTTLDAYTLLAISGGWHIDDTWTIDARVDNLTDEDYVLAAGYATPGIAAFAGVSAAY
ncbi:MAG: TonB-dependent receptor domain-containing protein, partial [Planctomycetota bacterium]